MANRCQSAIYRASQLGGCGVDHGRCRPGGQVAVSEPSTVDRCARKRGDEGEERYQWGGWKHWCSASCKA